jgi:predicted metalloprotease with PDZ domain
MKVLLALLFVAGQLSAQTIEYEVRFPNAVHHETEVSITFPGVKRQVLEVRMSRTSPGRYALHEFAKNVYRVKAVDGAGKALEITRPNLHQWNVTGHGGTVKFSYTLFGDHADGTYLGIDESHAHLNAPASFAWARGLEGRPVRIRFVPPEGLGWKVATQLKATGDPFVFEAPNRDYFLDSPVEMSDYMLREFEVNDGKRTQTIRVALHHQGGEAEADEYARMIERVVKEQAGVFGEFPEFDYGVYTFLLDYLPWVDGDGMEHRNSTYCVSTRSLARAGKRLIGTVAHEFFHAWNVERLRPASLEPFDFEEVSVPEELWFGEGFTSYYTPLTMVRAGLTDLEGYAERLAGVGYIVNAPGRRFVSPVEASMGAALSDGASRADATNLRNTYVSYYSYGSAVGLGLDLTLRTRFEGVSLDDYMKALWVKFGRPEKPFVMGDLERTLAEVTGDEEFTNEFFRRYVRGREVVDYEALLKHAGLFMRRAEPDVGVLGESGLRFGKDGAVLGSEPLQRTPLYEAGLGRGARILRLDGKRIGKRKDWERALRKKKPGDTVEIEYEQRGRSGVKTVALAASPKLEVVTFESLGMTVDEDVREFRAAWLGSKAIGGR